MPQISTSDLDLLHDQCVQLLIDETGSLSIQEKLTEAVFGQSGGAYVAFLKEIRAIIDWTYIYQAGMTPYEQHHSAFTTGGR